MEGKRNMLTPWVSIKSTKSFRSYMPVTRSRSDLCATARVPITTTRTSSEARSMSSTMAFTTLAPFCSVISPTTPITSGARGSARGRRCGM